VGRLFLSFDFATAADGRAGHEPSTRHGLICRLTTAPTGAKILPRETPQIPDLMMSAFPQGALYRRAEKNEDANPQGDKNCINHNS
jgi:hypothetical protein